MVNRFGRIDPHNTAIYRNIVRLLRRSTVRNFAVSFGAVNYNSPDVVQLRQLLTMVVNEPGVHNYFMMRSPMYRLSFNDYQNSGNANIAYFIIELYWNIVG